MEILQTLVKSKIESVLFASKCKIRKVPKLNVTYKNVQIIHHSKITDLGFAY